MSDQSFFLQFKFTPKIGHTFTDEREVVVEVPKESRLAQIGFKKRKPQGGTCRSCEKCRADTPYPEPLPSIARFGGVRGLFTFPSVQVRKCCPAPRSFTCRRTLMPDFDTPRHVPLRTPFCHLKSLQLRFPM